MSSEKTKEQLLSELAGQAQRIKDLEHLFQQVETAKRQWESTVDCIDDMVFFADSKGRIQRCNKAVREFLGHAYENIIGKDWQAVFREQGIAIDLAGGNMENVEVLHGPTERWFTASSYDFRDLNNPNASGRVITLHDITAMKMLAESLEITNTKLDSERKDLQFALDELSFLLRKVEKEKDLSLRFRKPDTSVSDPVYQIGERFNNMMEMLESGHNELEQAYADLKTAQSQILQQEKMASIGQLAAGIAHEINNPTGFILSNLTSLKKYTDRYFEFIALQSAAIAELAKSGESSASALLGGLQEKRKALKLDYLMEDTKQLIEESVDGAERIKKIVQDLKNFSHIDSAEWKMEDINAGLESTINIVWNELKYKAVVKKEYGNIPAAWCNIRQLNQVFVNLLINAAHAIREKGDIIIKTWEDAGYVHISISDTGCGIPPENLNRIFEPFFTTKEVGKGTGLGLSVAYDIVKKHNGEIKVESTPGKGTTFTIKVPTVKG